MATTEPPTDPSAPPPPPFPSSLTFDHLLHQTIHGLHTLFFRAFPLVLHDPYVWSLHKKLLLPLLFFSLFLYFLLVLPLSFLFYLFRLSAHTAKLTGYYHTLTHTTLPLLLSLLLRFVFYSPLDKCYLSILSHIHPSLAKELNTRTHTHTHSIKEILKREGKRLIWGLVFFPVYIFLSFIPFVGRWLKFAWKVYTLSKYFDSWSLTLGVCVCTSFPLIDKPSTYLLQFFLSLVGFVQETQLPLWGRVGGEKGEDKQTHRDTQAQIGKGEKREGKEKQMETHAHTQTVGAGEGRERLDLDKPLSRRGELSILLGKENPNRVALLVFCLPLYVLLFVPYVGPLTIIVSHAVAPVALVELILGKAEEEGEKRKDE